MTPIATSPPTPTARAVQTETRIYPRGFGLTEALAPDLEARWEAGDAHLRSIVERVDSLGDHGA